MKKNLDILSPRQRLAYEIGEKAKAEGKAITTELKKKKLQGIQYYDALKKLGLHATPRKKKIEPTKPVIKLRKAIKQPDSLPVINRMESPLVVMVGKAEDVMSAFQKMIKG